MIFYKIRDLDNPQTMHKLLFFIVALLLPSANLFAHAKGEDYIFINVLEQSIEGEFQVNVEDLRGKLGIDITGTDEKSLSNLQQHNAAIFEYIHEHFAIIPASGTPYTIDFAPSGPLQATEDFVRYPFSIATGSAPKRLTIHHNMYYQQDRTHRGLLLLQYNVVTDKNYGAEYTALIFNPTNQVQELDLENVSGLIRKREMVAEGVWHIWIGIDHILFLLALMLPIVLVRKGAAWHPVERAGPASRSLVGIVTVFTIAHSITLLLAAFDLIPIQPRIVESVIALSIVVVALNNIFQWISRGALLTIFVLGLFHGFGFASVMGNLPFRMTDLVTMVVLFNIGVEVGQVAIVAALFPLLYWLRVNRHYIPIVLTGGSWALAAIGGFWFLQRSLGFG